jgi:hypothetical protein
MPLIAEHKGIDGTGDQSDKIEQLSYSADKGSLLPDDTNIPLGVREMLVHSHTLLS